MRTSRIHTAISLMAALMWAAGADAQAAGGGGRPVWIYVVLGVIVLFLLIVALALFQYIALLVQAYMSSAKVSPFDLIGMRLRKVDPRVIVLNRIRAVKAGLNI